jgi:hypothetical protein
MGYYTRYRIDAVIEPVQGTFCDNLREFTGEKFRAGRETDEWKWYEHDEHIVTSMSRSGATRVEIHGEGEEQGDVWDKVYTLTDDGQIRLEKYRYETRRSADPQVTTFARKS